MLLRILKSLLALAAPAMALIAAVPEFAALRPSGAFA